MSREHISPAAVHAPETPNGLFRPIDEVSAGGGPSNISLSEQLEAETSPPAKRLIQELSRYGDDGAAISVAASPVEVEMFGDSVKVLVVPRLQRRPAAVIEERCDVAGVPDPAPRPTTCLGAICGSISRFFGR
jgi:hypothetical protein